MYGFRKALAEANKIHDMGFDVDIMYDGRELHLVIKMPLLIEVDKCIQNYIEKERI